MHVLAVLMEAKFECYFTQLNLGHKLLFCEELEQRVLSNA